MRQLTIFCIAIILPALAAGQATVISGYAVNGAPPGVYAEPFVPRAISTLPTPWIGRVIDRSWHRRRVSRRSQYVDRTTAVGARRGVISG
ncbi:MAG: hypothetical protein AUI17_04885 [Acidobacteriales bacterium 13_2_20CM_2_55_5]|nr:MAG: hypothetical protein AUI17_04885 [Acidobacteriales bacterium 13_2_20CM_2_55_5]